MMAQQAGIHKSAIAVQISCAAKQHLYNLMYPWEIL